MGAFELFKYGVGIIMFWSPSKPSYRSKTLAPIQLSYGLIVRFNGVASAALCLDPLGRARAAGTTDT